MIEKAKQTNSLFLKRVNIKSLPAAIFELTNLETLIINGVTLDKIPAEIGIKVPK